MTAPLPPNEAERLKALYNYAILDTAPESTFERMTARASLLFDAPIAMISLLDSDRQWFKACYGVDARETSRESSFCAYAILKDEVMAIPDTHEDFRFANHMVVTGPPHIRFYAGAPLKTPAGHNLGTFCVADTKPREFTIEQQTMLADLAAIVVDQLELRRLHRELNEERLAFQQSEQRFRQLAEAINHVFWMRSADGKEILYISPAYEKILGHSFDDLLSIHEHWMQAIHPDDRGRVWPKFLENGATNFEEQYRIARPDGSYCWIKDRSFPVYDENGKVYRIAGVAEDITRTKEAEGALREAKVAMDELNQELEGRVRERTADLASSQVEILQRLARAAEYRDDNTGQHTQRVGRTAALLAQALGLPPAQIELIRYAAPLHDVGKIAISDLILLKPGKLTDEEFAVMKTHASAGAIMLSSGSSEIVQMAERIAGSHHERWDGRGYPLGLACEDIPLEGRIVAVADVFDALTHERPYKKAWSVAEAIAEIERQSGHQFAPQMVAAFLTLPHEELL